MKYIFGLLFLTGTLFGQSTVAINFTLPSISKMDIEPSGTALNLALTTPAEAGTSVLDALKDSSKWLNFTSAVGPSTSRRITAQVLETNINGLSLKMGIANYAGNGAGVLGTSTSSIILNNSAQTIINGIGGAYTGDGTGKGYNLSYSLEIANFSQLRNVTKSYTVKFTMSDN